MRERNGIPSGREVARPFVVAILVALGGAGLLFAHSRLLRSAPREKAELSAPPKQIELWFDELLDRAFNRVEVFPAAELRSKNRPNLTVGQPKLDPEDRTHLIANLAPLSPGDYMVEWQVLSRDGHSVRGRFAFRILAPPGKR